MHFPNAKLHHVDPPSWSIPPPPYLSNQTVVVTRTSRWLPMAKPKLWRLQLEMCISTHTRTWQGKSVWKLNSTAAGCGGKGKRALQIGLLAYRELNWNSTGWVDSKWLCACHWLKQMGSTTSFTVSCNLSPCPFGVGRCCCLPPSTSWYINKINIYIEMQRNRAQQNWISELCHWLFVPFAFCLSAFDLSAATTKLDNRRNKDPGTEMFT